MGSLRSMSSTRSAVSFPSVGKKYSGQLLGSGRNVELALNKSERGTLGANVELRLRGNW
jgi:hypothetical protein